MRRPGPLQTAATRINHPLMQHPFFAQRIRRGLAAHASSNHEHIEQAFTIKTGACGHPVRRRVIQASQVVGHAGFKRPQGFGILGARCTQRLRTW